MDFLIHLLWVLPLSLFLSVLFMWVLWHLLGHEIDEQNENIYEDELRGKK